MSAKYLTSIWLPPIVWRSNLSHLCTVQYAGCYVLLCLTVRKMEDLFGVSYAMGNPLVRILQVSHANPVNENEKLLLEILSSIFAKFSFKLLNPASICPWVCWWFESSSYLMSMKLPIYECMLFFERNSQAPAQFWGTSQVLNWQECVQRIYICPLGESLSQWR